MQLRMIADPDLWTLHLQSHLYGSSVWKENDMKYKNQKQSNHNL